MLILEHYERLRVAGCEDLWSCTLWFPGLNVVLCIGVGSTQAEARRRAV